MSYFKSELPTEKLFLPSDPDYWVVMRAATNSDKKAARAALIRARPRVHGRGKHAQDIPLGSDGDTDVSLVTEIDNEAYETALVLRLVVEWNLTTATGEVAPINEGTLGQLTPEDGDFISSEARRRISSRAQNDPFERPSSPSSSDTAQPTLEPSANSGGSH